MESIRRFINTECSEYNGDSAKNVVVSENNVKYHLVNDIGGNVVSYQYDNCINKENNGGCDYIITLEKQNQETVFLIELKASSQLKDALNQIDKTLQRLKFEKSVKSVLGRIVLHSVPAIQTSWAIKLDRKLKQLNGDLKYKSGRIFKEIFN